MLKNESNERKKLLAYRYSTPRTLLFYFAVLTLLITSVISGVGFVLNSLPIILTGSVVLILWFVMIFAGILPQTNITLNRRIKLLKQGALIIFISIFILGLMVAMGTVIFVPRLIQNQNISTDFRQLMSEWKDGYEYTDATALSQQAVENLFKGQNPYTHANVVQALLKYNGTYDRVTPLREGMLSDVFPYPQNSQLEQIWDKAIQTPSQVPPELESKVCYPAGSFLLPAPFVFLGITDIRIVYFIFVLAGLVYALWIIPKRKRLLFIGIVLISLELWNSIGGGRDISSLCFPFLIVAWLSLNRNLWLSAICMGLAAATKQTAWFFIPFYLILVFRKQGVKKSLVVSSIIAVIFIITNLPFAIADPKIWISSITSPMTDQMFPMGNGLVTLVTSGIWHMQSPLPFTILEGTAFIIAMLWYFRYCNRYPQTGLVLAIIPLFFAWRSQFSYFFYVDIISLAYIMLNDDASWETIPPGVNPSDNVP